jgi:hypothetical protein
MNGAFEKLAQAREYWRKQRLVSSLSKGTATLRRTGGATKLTARTAGGVAHRQRCGIIRGYLSLFGVLMGCIAADLRFAISPMGHECRSQGIATTAAL